MTNTLPIKGTVTGCVNVLRKRKLGEKTSLKMVDLCYSVVPTPVLVVLKMVRYI
jgi:hypothetical protein